MAQHLLPARARAQHTGAGYGLIAALVTAILVSGFSTGRSEEKEHISGNLRVDLFGLTAMRKGPMLQETKTVNPMPSHKSLWLAAGLSAVVPGSGEFYAESYWKAAAFLLVDVAAWVLAYSYDKRGDRKTDEFQDFANQHWSVVQYAKFAETKAPPGKAYAWRVPGTEGMNPYDRPWTQVDWSELNRMERDIAGYFSHTLPAYNEQQYYELIGKYPQFNQGWDDAGPSFNYGDPLTPRFLSYAVERGTANDFYTNATTWVTVALVNHLLSAADAAWSAGMYNSAHASVGMRLIPTGTGYTGMARLTVEFGL